MDKIGAASNKNNKVEFAVSYSEAKIHTNQYFLENSKDFVSPKYVKTLPARKQLRGKIETVDEVFYLKKLFYSFDKKNLN